MTSQPEPIPPGIPTANPIQCNVAHFSGDWGDPFAMVAEVTKDIASGDIKPAGTETINGIKRKSTPAHRRRRRKKYGSTKKTAS